MSKRRKLPAIADEIVDKLIDKHFPNEVWSVSRALRLRDLVVSAIEFGQTMKRAKVIK